MAVPFSTLTSVDATGNVTNDMTGSLHHARWFGSGVVLPDGQVLAVAGADKDEVVLPDSEIPVLVPELYDPVTGRLDRSGDAGSGPHLPQHGDPAAGHAGPPRWPCASAERVGDGQP